MASVSSVATLAGLDRPAADRPDPKAADASDGAFAGLMAQFVQPLPSPSAPTHGEPPKPEGETPKEGAQPAGALGSPGPAVPTEAQAPDAATPTPTAAAPASAASATPTVSALQAQPEPAPQGLLLPKDLRLPTGGPQGLPGDPSAVPGSALPPTQDPGLAPPQGASQAPTDAAPALLTALPSTATPTGILRLPAPDPAPMAVPPLDPELKETLKPSLAPMAAALGSATPAAAHLTNTVQIQAVLAAPSPSASGSRGSGSATDSPVLAEGKVAKLAASQLLPQDQTPAALPPKALSLPGLTDSESTPAPTSGKGFPLPLAPEATGAGLLPEPPSTALRAQDGSSLAALTTAARAPEAATPAALVPAPAPAPAPPPTAPVQQVDGSVRWMLKTGAQEAQLQLHPDSLGQVTIHLRVEGGEVHAKLWVTEPTSVQAVQEGRPHLEQSLKEQGLALGSFDLQQGHRPFQDTPAAPASREQTPSEAVLARQEAPAPTPVAILNARHVELYA